MVSCKPMSLANKNHKRRNRETRTRTRTNNKTPKNYDKFDGTNTMLTHVCTKFKGSASFTPPNNTKRSISMYLYMCVCIQMMCFTTRMDHVLKLNELLKAQL